MTDKGHLAHRDPPAEVLTCRKHPRGRRKEKEGGKEGRKAETKAETPENQWASSHSHRFFQQAASQSVFWERGSVPGNGRSGPWQTPTEHGRLPRCSERRQGTAKGRRRWKPGGY
ncbi:hypothetical protein EYF80_010553 [Liparis tanakae]|uniref:Uncharacterized protein n=1 Tax=Liparis tanakae TaxID=230148 RepID=A0A4Z2INR8_9TELE|nr:hypothetical protein EYF80_010553 [Liparis tanakae]